MNQGIGIYENGIDTLLGSAGNALYLTRVVCGLEAFGKWGGGYIQERNLQLKRLDYWNTYNRPVDWMASLAVELLDYEEIAVLLPIDVEFLLIHEEYRRLSRYEGWFNKIFTPYSIAEICHGIRYTDEYKKYISDKAYKKKLVYMSLQNCRDFINQKCMIAFFGKHPNVKPPKYGVAKYKDNKVTFSSNLLYPKIVCCKHIDGILDDGYLSDDDRVKKISKLTSDFKPERNHYYAIANNETAFAYKSDRGYKGDRAMMISPCFVYFDVFGYALKIEGYTVKEFMEKPFKERVKLKDRISHKPILTYDYLGEVDLDGIVCGSFPLIILDVTKIMNCMRNMGLPNLNVDSNDMYFFVLPNGEVNRLPNGEAVERDYVSDEIIYKFNPFNKDLF